MIERFARWPLEIIRLGVLGQGRLWGGLHRDTSATVGHLRGHDPGPTPSLSVFLALKSMAPCRATVHEQKEERCEMGRRELDLIWSRVIKRSLYIKMCKVAHVQTLRASGRLQVNQ